MISYFNYY